MRKTIAPLFSRIDVLILGLIIVVALVVRLYHIDAPLADFHSWRQADTAAVARNFVRGGFDLLHPRFDDFSNTASGLDNPQGYRFVEFPIYNAIFAELYQLSPTMPIEVYGRLTTIFFSIVIIVCLYYLALKEFGRVGAAASAMVYAVFPFFIFFSRVVLPETMAISLTMVSITFLYVFSYGKNNLRHWLWFALSIVCFALALLIKPTVIFYGLALLYLFIIRYKLQTIKRVDIYAFFVLCAIPLALWRMYILKYPEGIPASDWLFTSVNTPQGLQNIFLRPAFFRWIFFERISNVILGGYMVFFMILGTVSKGKSRFLMFILGSALAYLFVFEGGNVQHEYYQTLILPALALAAGSGIELFLSKRYRPFVNVITACITVIVITLLSIGFSYNTVKDYYQYPTDLPQIAHLIQSLTKPTDLIVTDSTGDTTLLYLSDRRGSPVQFKELPEMKKMGYSYLVSFEPEKIANLKKAGLYPVVFENDKLAIFHL